ncbi:MAG: thermostable hemolysin [Methylococcaceae bacterium]|nr:thermostable hemolysin [Methylococcaceae bacterium]
MFSYPQQKLFIEILQQHSPGRDEAEGFLKIRFKKHYGAKLTEFLPNILCLRNEDKKIIAALGFQIADEKPLFFEQYLSQPIENHLENLSNQKQTRNRIVEVGNLASVSAGGSRCLIAALTAYLKAEGAEWVAFTAQTPLLNSFASMGIEIFTLQQAIPDFMSDKELKNWGNYYDHKPVIATGNVLQGFEALRQQFLQEQSFNTFRFLLLNAYATGLKQLAI